LALSGLDAASTFGGMGSSREMTVLAVFEPIILVVLGAIAFVFNSFDFYVIFEKSLICSGSYFSSLELTSSCSQLFILIIPISMSLFVILIVEIARIPVDNPETHLELTMIHEAMILEQTGPNLAMLEISHGMKQTLLMGILINIFFPIGLGIGGSIIGIVVGLGFFLVKATILAIIVGIFESSIAKFRLLRLPSLFTIAFFLPIISIAVVVFLPLQI